MKSISALLIYNVLFIVTVFSVHAQAPLPYQFESLNANDGLTHGEVNCVFKDRNGFIWIGTGNGLNLYNGYALKVFRNNPRDSTSLRGNHIEAIFEDPEGKIWIRTQQGISIYDPVLETFHDLGEAELKKYRLPNLEVLDISTYNSDTYWFVNKKGGITSYNTSDKQTTHLTPPKLATNDVTCLRYNTQGDVWIMHTNGVLQKLDKSSHQVIETYKDLFAQYANMNINYEFMVDSMDDLWIYLLSYGKGVYQYNPTNKSLISYNKSSEKLRLNNDFVIDAVEESPGVIWLGTDHGGINIIDKQKNKVTYIEHHPEVNNSLSHNSIYCLYKDRDNIIWVGTYKNGVNFYHKGIKRFRHYKNLVSEPGSLPFDDVNRFVEDQKGNIWIGTNGGGLLYFDREKNTFKQYKADPNDPKSISSNVIVSMLLDRQHTLWVGTYMGGLNTYNGDDFERFEPDDDDAASISDDNIWELMEDSKGNVWVGTLSHGLDKYNREKKAFEHFQVDTLKTQNSLHSNYILALEEDDNGNIWVGGGNGIDIFNPKSKKVRHIESEPKDSVGLASNTIYCFHKDSKGQIWVGTQQGLHVYGKKGALSKLFTTVDGLPHNTIFTILEDNDHNIWVSTPNGLSHIIVNENGAPLNAPKFINYDESDGLQSKVFNENAALKTTDGMLFFGGPNGFNVFDPAEIEVNKDIPEVVFTGFHLFNEKVEVGEKQNGRILLNKALSYTDQVTLKHYENVFSIEFAALNFLHPGKNKYRYKLEGFDKQWRVTSSHRVTYTNLDPGNYTFRVLASNNDGFWNEKGTSLNIKVRPPFWKTAWAYTVYTLLVLAALYLGRKMMLRRERLKFQIEQERREARQMHELDLLKIRFFTNVSHEFRTPLSLILAPLEKLLGSGKDDMQSRQLQMIHRNAKRLLNLVNQLLDFRKLEVDTIGLHPSEGNIVRFVEESVKSFSDLSENKNIELTFDSTTSDFFASFDMDKLEKVLFNLLSNAFKFTPEKGKVHVEVSSWDSDKDIEELKVLQIRISDTGIGISKEQQNKIFTRFFRSDTPGSVLNQGSGIGLAITKEFVKIHGGTIHVDSELGKGTVFTVRIPVKVVRQTHQEEKPLEKANLSDVIHGIASHTQDTPLVLLVEDNEDFRFYLKDNLGVHFKILEAQNGKEGWQKALSALPDLIVSDLSMPEMNGMELCEKVKADNRTSHIPFVLLTAHSNNDKKLKGLNVGADDYITKPFNFEILLSRIKNLIQQRQAMQEAFTKKITVETSEVDIISLDDKLIQQAIKVVEENISNPDLSVEMLSRELGMSRTHLYKKMVSLTGKTPVEFIRKIRLQRAAQFLRKSQLTVAEVAYQVGFNNRKYFSKYFKMEYDVLPSTYAEQHNK
ncbi:hybrid sensor histidine kinase/response regulator transcription factor [Fulvivirga sediminis]|uniref:histidine kinase n=1 Tax=Fulvivirga sediminis TaxID=2803949 RepID=A0A937F6M6_9BACT|nr:two-component regulator propeller domain-containing protein [Fulvivirga sediminis]MBL3655604.1 response regulator [Fulvivirga sediminis]